MSEQTFRLVAAVDGLVIEGDGTPEQVVKINGQTVPKVGRIETRTCGTETYRTPGGILGRFWKKEQDDDYNDEEVDVVWRFVTEHDRLTARRRCQLATSAIEAAEKERRQARMRLNLILGYGQV